MKEVLRQKFLASDQITLFGLESSGTDINIVLSNETHIIPVSDLGAATYTGSGTTIKSISLGQRLWAQDSCGCSRAIILLE